MSDTRPDAPPPGHATGHKGLVDRVRDILLKPKDEWAVIDAEPATIGSIYRNYVCILAAIPPIAAAVGALLFGYNAIVVTIRPSVTTVVANAVITYLLSLAMVYVLALIINALAPTFGGVKDEVKAFKVAAYSSTAGWVAGILAILPALAPIAALLGLYNLFLLYLGLPRLMKTPEDKSIGYIVVTIIVAIVAFLVVGMIASAITSAVFRPSVTLPYG